MTLIPRYPNLAAVRAAYNSKELLRSGHVLIALIRLFPTIANLYPDDYDGDSWHPDELAQQIRKLSVGEAQSAKFCLLIYNWMNLTTVESSKRCGWKIGLFNISEAATHWTAEEKAIFVDWLMKPWFL